MPRVLVGLALLALAGCADAREVILPGSGHNAGGVEAARQAVVELLGRLPNTVKP